jgi:hypothetical protein
MLTAAITTARPAAITVIEAACGQQRRLQHIHGREMINELRSCDVSETLGDIHGIVGSLQEHIKWLLKRHDFEAARKLVRL